MLLLRADVCTSTHLQPPAAHAPESLAPPIRRRPGLRRAGLRRRIPVFVQMFVRCILTGGQSAFTEPSAELLIEKMSKSDGVSGNTVRGRFWNTQHRRSCRRLSMMISMRSDLSPSPSISRAFDRESCSVLLAGSPAGSAGVVGSSESW